MAYEKAHFETIPPYERLIFDYLQRKYGLDTAFSAKQSPISSPTKEQGIDQAQFAARERIAYPNNLVSVIPDASGDTMSQMLIKAANCDHIPLDDNFGELVGHNIATGNYYVTHVALALHFLSDNGCSYFGIVQTRQLQQTVAAEVDKLAKDPQTKADLRYEAIATLLDMGRRDLVSQSELRQITREQLPNGGWSGSQDGINANNHSTLLAIWVMLQDVYSNAPNEPIIRRPG